MQPAEVRRIVWWVFGIALALIAIYAIGYGTRLGWFGVGLIGLAILSISTQVELGADHPFSTDSHGSTEIGLVARQIAAGSEASPEERLALAAMRAKRSHVLYLVRGVGLVLTIVGFALFVKQQL